MSIDWSQEQGIPNTWNGSTASFTPTQAGYMVIAVQGQGTPTQFGWGYAYATDGITTAVTTGGNFLCGSTDNGNIYANMWGSGTLPVASGVTFTLGANISSLNQINPFIYFYWIPASGTDGLQVARDKDKIAALVDRLKAASVVEVPGKG